MILKCDNITRLIKENNIVIFGAGVIARKYLELYNINVKYYVDNDVNKWNTLFEGKEIKNPEILKTDKDNIIFICSEYVDEISEQLNSFGLKINNQYFIPRDLEEEYIKDNSGIYEESEVVNKKQPRILIDMSSAAWTNKNSPGISRVVKNLVKEAYLQNKYDIIAVQRAGDNLYEPSEYLFENKIINIKKKFKWNIVKIEEGDILLMPDAIWGQYKKFKNIITKVHKMKGKVINIVHDIIFLQYPQFCTSYLKSRFEDMFTDILSDSDGIITVSKSVADDIAGFAQNKNIFLKRDFKIGWFHNGFSVNQFGNMNFENTEIKNIMEKRPFITVGTIEPRKGHKVILDAFDELWKNNKEVNLCIIGKIGWMSEELINRIKNHEKYGKKLFLIEQPNDSELRYCYQNAEALIFASYAEGFGLPLIEGAYHGLPLILSNINTFKELAGESAMYFQNGNSDELSDIIDKYIILKEKNKLPNSKNIQIVSWRDSFNTILDILYNNKWYLEC